MGVEGTGRRIHGSTWAGRVPAKDSLDILMVKALRSSLGSAVPSAAVWDRIQQSILQSQQRAARGSHATR
jgi:hypothetical protein